ncbi:Putative N2,N2-dimethylguanosine tRNA methyltransferase [Plasmopara halstedii]|uniref:Putative N2,N2-dimethylguanosine tRNA methyltransferase n=1 Tax=Plasmopara halstedii TaxID=4781 RepID=A0A0N7L6P2_PLAHL|nr:Putative N2,N2-dimethylguanosine tRNA methyltransferase [Plasmopara halstedii]CEG44827.1 Putative N2,N2-dimethylguanosine tRNA methyltransferase [Plasmopara halstedii]|eukprot:XP_024581196.1 Putative N2,N2-dimethylguanosine tRNA methyltransferase [Plasmopara halstedii]
MTATRHEATALAQQQQNVEADKTNSSRAGQMTLKEKEDATTIVWLRVHVDDDSQSETMLGFECNWKPGIGGSIWTSGVLLAAHLELYREYYRTIFEGARVVEIGSGTGYVGLMVAACFRPAHVYLTDLSTHVNGLQRNVERNARAVRTGVQVHVSELSWGSLEQEMDLLESMAVTSDVNDNKIKAASQIDVILGTDVAYLQELYDPLLHTINHLATSRTLILLGLNRVDTSHAFFQQLEQNGFEYYKIPDFKLPKNYWGRDFGLFEIRRSVQSDFTLEFW